MVLVLTQHISILLKSSRVKVLSPTLLSSVAEKIKHELGPSVQANFLLTYLTPVPGAAAIQLSAMRGSSERTAW